MPRVVKKIRSLLRLQVCMDPRKYQRKLCYCLRRFRFGELTMRLLFLLVFCSLLAGLLPASAELSYAEAKPARDYISKVRIGGWIGNNALLVLPDRSAAATPIGKNYGSVKLLEIGDNSFTAEYNGVKGKVTIDPGWQLAPHPDLSNWIIAYMKNIATRVDAQYPDVSQQGIIRVMHNGAVASNFIKVQQSAPFDHLSDWMESMDLKVTINPHQATQLQFVGLTVTPQAYSRLVK